MEDIKIWEEYKSKKSSQLREQLIIKYAPLVKYVAGKMSIRFINYIEYDDLISYGVFGLIDAIEKFDYTKGIKFETYASIRIRGEIIDNIRKLDWVPRLIRQKSQSLENAYLSLESNLGRVPLDHEIAEELNVSVSKIKDMYREASILSIISLDDFLDQNHEGVFDAINNNTLERPEVAYGKLEIKEILVSAIKNLSEKEQKVISLYYFDDLTLKEISKIMHVSESRISQLHSKAVFKLKEKLQKYKSSLFST